MSGGRLKVKMICLSNNNDNNKGTKYLKTHLGDVSGKVEPVEHDDTRFGFHLYHWNVSRGQPN